MDEPNATFAAAGTLLRDGWDVARIERTLAKAERRRRRRKLVRSAAGLLSAALLFAAWARVGSSTTMSLHGAKHEPPTKPSVTAHLRQDAPRAPDPATTDFGQSVRAPLAEASDGGATNTELASSPVRSSLLRVRSLAAEQATSQWRAQLAAGDANAAYELLRTAPVRLGGLDDYLLAADTARRAGEPLAAVRYLERALKSQPGERSAVAAFTQGRILLDELARPADAARAFAEVERRARHAPLLADALAREVDAWRAAGELVRAKARASVYLSRFPSGDHARRMRRLLEEPAP